MQINLEEFDLAIEIHGCHWPTPIRHHRMTGLSKVVAFLGILNTLCKLGLFFIHNKITLENSELSTDWSLLN